MPTTLEFEDVLKEIFHIAQMKGSSYVVMTAGELHRRVGGYPGRDHRMPVCCNVMRRMLQKGDEILDEPMKGTGASLKIRYKLPRE